MLGYVLLNTLKRGERGGEGRDEGRGEERGNDITIILLLYNNAGYVLYRHYCITNRCLVQPRLQLVM